MSSAAGTVVSSGSTCILGDLLVDVSVVSGTDDALQALTVNGVEYDSRRCTAGSLFVCIRGFEFDGHQFAGDAVERGAVALVVEHPVDCDVPQVVVPDTRIALATIARNFWDDPSQRVKVFGITGTNGKTTTTYILDSILRAHGHTTGLVGTVEVRVGDRTLPADRTTPESAAVQRLLADMATEGVTAASIEVSSHAIDLHRIDGISFEAVAFTNLTQDHLDYHRSLEEYRAVKTRLFFEHPARARVIDIDTTVGAELAELVSAHHSVVRVGRSDHADVRAVDERPSSTGTAFRLVSPQGTREVHLPLAGAYNVSNALVAAGCGLTAGINLDSVVRGLESAPQVPGRLERITCGQQFSVVVDYAHTPDSLEKALSALRSVTQGAVRVVFGCGGDRDPSKRPIMGRAAGEYADYVVVTSDNPRSEDPVGIVRQVEDGVRQSTTPYEIVVDRGQAIARAIGVSHPGDCVLIAGKGHETYQIFADHTAHFDDREVARRALVELGYTQGCDA